MYRCGSLSKEKRIKGTSINDLRSAPIFEWSPCTLMGRLGRGREGSRRKREAISVYSIRVVHFDICSSFVKNSPKLNHFFLFFMLFFFHNQLHIFETFEYLCNVSFSEKTV